MHRLLITGAAGVIGGTLRVGLRDVADQLRLADVRPLVPEHPKEEVLVADVHDFGAARAATEGVDCVVHLAGVPREAAWAPILRDNIEATYNLFEAARLNGVGRVVFASTNHVVGYYRAGEDVNAVQPPRPDSRYAVSKVLGEALGRLYADKHGLSVACLRIGSFRELPENVRQLATWISPRDLTELVRCCLTTPRFHFLALYGVSGNRRARWRDDAREIVGLVPRDDAELYAAELDAGPAEPPSAGTLFHGGENCGRGFTGDLNEIN